MERGALDERESAGPPGRSLLGEGLAHPHVRASVFVHELPQRERSSYSSSQLARHRLELEAQLLAALQVVRGPRESTMRAFPLESRALEIRRHVGAA